MKFRYLEVKLYKIYLDDTEAFIKAMDEDYFKEDVFEFCHPLDKKKPFIRHYVFLPANGNTFMMVGQCTHPLDSACVAVVINSENYKSSYVAIYDYERVVDNSDQLMESLVHGFNKKLKGYGAKMTYEFWDIKPEDARWSDDFLLTFTHNYHLTKGKNVAKMGYEDVPEQELVD